jgi:hypothetical protein
LIAAANEPADEQRNENVEPNRADVTEDEQGIEWKRHKVK